MATTFPDTIQQFPTMIDITADDVAALNKFQQAMQSGNISEAQKALGEIKNYETKIITAQYMNTLYDTCVALEEYYGAKYSPGYIVSAQQPTMQNPTDFWFKVIKEV